MTRWRLLVDPDLSGDLNMALDEVALERLIAGLAPPTLRLYGWRCATVTLGRHQTAAVVDSAFCKQHRIPIVRRPTGGRAVVHHLELTYAVTASLAGPLVPQVQESYRRLCAALVRAFRDMGVPAELSPGHATRSLPRPSSPIPCFSTPAGGEVVVDGRKLVGSAMRTHHGHLLQHGAILLDWHGPLQAGCLGLADDTQIRPLVTTVTEQLGAAPPSRAQMVEIIAKSFSTELGIGLERAQRPRDEAHTAEQRAAQLLEPATTTAVQ